MDGRSPYRRMEDGSYEAESNGKSSERNLQEVQTSKNKVSMAYEESRLQQECVSWFRFQYPKYAHVLIHVPNEGNRAKKMVYTKYGAKVVCSSGARLKAEGMVAGVADLLLLVQSGEYGSLAIEMKTQTGRLSDSQKEWRKDCEAAGNKYVVCRSFEQFMCEVVDYMKNIAK